MDTQLTDAALTVDRPPATVDGAQFPPDDILILVIRQYFTMLRQEKGHHPDASPMDLEILLILKFVCAGCDSPIELLKRVGIIVMNECEELYIAINNSLLVDILVSSRSRINNTLKKLNWLMKEVSNNEKWILLKPLLDRTDVRNWTVRRIPHGSLFYDYVAVNPQVQFHPGTNTVPAQPDLSMRTDLQVETVDVPDQTQNLSEFT